VIVVEDERSNIRDPDHKLSTDAGKIIDDKINSLIQVELAVVIIHRMSTTDRLLRHSKSKEQQAEKFARNLHDKWGIGNEETLKGILLFLSISDRVVYISTGDGVTEKLSFQAVQAIIFKMSSSLKEENYGEGIAIAIKEIETFLNVTSKQTGDAVFSESQWEACLAIVGLACLLSCIIFYIISAFEDSLREGTRSKDTRKRKRYCDDYCYEHEYSSGYSDSYGEYENGSSVSYGWTSNSFIGSSSSSGWGGVIPRGEEVNHGKKSNISITCHGYSSRFYIILNK
jgi:uncharacterized membrane protein YgcG